MTSNIRFLDPAIVAYATDHSTPPDRVQQQLIRATADLGAEANMQIGPLQGAFMSVLTTALRPKLAIEIGRASCRERV